MMIMSVLNCVKYHQSKKEKHSDRISVLMKLEDKYNYEGVNYPATFEDIQTFEKHNKVVVFISFR